MVLLDVVYNHFGPDGNYLPAYAPEFFHPDRQHPLGRRASPTSARRSAGSSSTTPCTGWTSSASTACGSTRSTMSTTRTPPRNSWSRSPRTVRAAFPDRHVHLTTEDNRNVTHLHERGPGRRGRALHRRVERRLPQRRPRRRHRRDRRLLRRLRRGRWAHFARALAEGFAYQGEPSPTPAAPARRAERPPAAHRLRRLPAEPRPDRQPRLRRAADRARAASRWSGR